MGGFGTCFVAFVVCFGCVVLHCCALALLRCVAGCLALVAGGVFCASEVGCFVMWVGLVMGCLVCGVVVWV